MRLVPDMDAGPIYRQVVFPLTGYETKPQLYNDLAHLGAASLIEALPLILDGSLIPIYQDNSLATFCQLLTKQDAVFHPMQVTAEMAERRIRAHLGFPKTKMSIFGHDIIITAGHVSAESKTPLDILCQDGAYLSIDELVGPSGRTMSAEAFLNGYAAG